MANGYILHEDTSRVVIATLESDNDKTANMVQIHILVKDESPVAAVRNGHDEAICGDCPARGHYDDAAGRFIERWCYVNYAQSENSVWRCYQRGGYEYLPQTRACYAKAFAGREVRFGSYGDPIHIPIRIVRLIVTVCNKHTGYTHQWRKPEYREYRAYFMASVESPQSYIDAQAAGWRTFRVRGENEPLEANEITCPASAEAGHRTHCQACCLCNGARDLATQAVKSIAIIVHGIGKNNLVTIGAIA